MSISLGKDFWAFVHPHRTGLYWNKFRPGAVLRSSPWGTHVRQVMPEDRGRWPSQEAACSWLSWGTRIRRCFPWCEWFIVKLQWHWWQETQITDSPQLYVLGPGAASLRHTPEREGWSVGEETRGEIAFFGRFQVQIAPQLEDRRRSRRENWERTFSEGSDSAIKGTVSKGGDIFDPLQGGSACGGWCLLWGLCISIWIAIRVTRTWSKLKYTRIWIIEFTSNFSPPP